MASLYIEFATMSFFARLISLRKQKGLTQQALADAIGLHITQIKRYEAGTSQPSLEAIKKIAGTLRVTTDSLILRRRSLRPTPIWPCSSRPSPACPGSSSPLSSNCSKA